MITNPCYKAALEYLAKKVSVIPVNKDKIPLILWKEFQTRLANENEVEAWWTTWPDANVGIVCGQISKIIVVDVEKGGDISRFPQTCLIKTGGGGWHLYYNFLPGFENKARIFPLTDIRGEGGYVVAPPSIHASGNKYEVIEKRILADFPVHLFDANYKNQKWQDIIQGVSQGERNETAAKVAGKLLRAFYKNDWDTIVYPMCQQWNLTNQPPLSEYELRNIYKSIKRREMAKMPMEDKLSDVLFVPFTEVLNMGIVELDDTKEEDVVSFGYDWLDDKLTGLFAGELAVLGGESGTGKTTMATNILYKASNKYKSGIFALEDRLEDYGIKALYFEIGKLRRRDGKLNYPWNVYRKNAIKDSNYRTYLEQAKENLKNENIFFADIPYQMNIELLEKTVEKKVEEGYKLFLIDHLHYFDLLRGDATKSDYVEKVMIKLKYLLRRTGVRIILIAHYRKLNGQKPAIDSFKDSIAIVQNANYVINLWRDRDLKKTPDYKTTISIPKSRNPNGEATIEVEFDPLINDYKPLPNNNWQYGTSEEVIQEPIINL